MKENVQSFELEKFGAVASTSEHDAIQKWRRNNPDGFILNMKSKNKGMLHGVDCPHFGDMTWEAAEHNLSNNRACPEFCVNGPLAGNCRLVRRHNEHQETRRT